MLTCASFFAGVGGIDLGFEETGFFKTIYANEFDPYPVETYELNFPIKVDCRDIHEVEPDDFDENSLNVFEKANRDLISKYEKEKGYR